MLEVRALAFHYKRFHVLTAFNPAQAKASTMITIPFGETYPNRVSSTSSTFLLDLSLNGQRDTYLAEEVASTSVNNIYRLI